MTLSISDLSKTYANGVKALDNVSLKIGQGMFGLLGPNGAGKSSLMRTIATLQTPDTGSVIFDGNDVLADPMSVRKVLGYLPQDFGVYPGVSAEDLLDFFATLKGIASKTDRAALIDYVLDVTNLKNVRRKHVSSYSGGMKQRFGIAQLLLNNPRLIIVDEPTAGLDPAERNRFLNVLREIASTNIVIFSTHLVDDIKDLCNEMAIMNEGRILLQTSPFIAMREIAGRIWTKNIGRAEIESQEARHTILSSSFNHDNSVNVRILSDQKPEEDFELATPDLEDHYFAILHQDRTQRV